MKLIIKQLLAVAILLFSTLSTWAYDFEVDGIYYNINDDGTTVSVTNAGDGFASYSGSVVIPSTVTYSGTTYSVTSIGDYAFSGCSGLTSVTIGNSVTSIGSYAFNGCSGLTSVTIPNSVTSIGEKAFYNCSGLTSVTIPNSVTSIGLYTFYGTAWYNNQPDGLVYAGKVAYKYKGTMPENTSITIKDGTLGIANFAFCNCSGLTSVTIPNSVTSIGDSAFYGCSGLTSVTIPNSVTKIDSRAFEDCSGLTSVTIPNSVTSIGYGAFYNCSGLTSVTIPNSVTSIGDGAFYKCSGLTSVVFNAENCTTMGSSSFPVFDGCSNLTSLTIGGNVKTIPSYAFYKCSGLTSVTIPNSVTSIGSDAFSGTTWYNNQPDGLVYAGKVAYKYKGSMPDNASITIKDGTLGIAGGAFENCSGLKSVTIPNSVTSIGKYAFENCFGLTDLTIGSSVNSIGASAFDIARLGRIKVLNPVPPTCVYNTVFKSVDKEKCLLTVPHGTIDLYSTTCVWCDFKRMKEDNGQGDI